MSRLYVDSHWDRCKGAAGMKLELRSIIAPGDLQNERLTLRVLSGLDIGDYLVAQTMLIDNYPTTSFEHMIWFPFNLVEKGDLIVVYTKTGTSRVRTHNQ